MKTQKKLVRKRAGLEVVAASAAPSGKLWWYAAGIFALVYAGFQAYGLVLNGPFVFDDGYLPSACPISRMNCAIGLAPTVPC